MKVCYWTSKHSKSGRVFESPISYTENIEVNRDYTLQNQDSTLYTNLDDGPSTDTGDGLRNTRDCSNH